ncbi:MAG TPA: hypothetical protein DCL42_08260 [Deltaproteobacteria bacterium]|nr:hypothetical protein [Deltaproteobacteria bacterium]HII69033.1 hypothetical protein [Candidatus Woesearchaeota archaeon]
MKFSWKAVVVGILLFTPLAAAGYWLWYLRRVQQAALSGFYLAPAANGPLIMGISLFIAGYLVFLGIIFYNNLAHPGHKGMD